MLADILNNITMDRKKFIISSTLTAFAMTTLGSIVKGSNGEFKGDCDTTNDILGPFYRPNAPIRTDLTYEGLAGTRIVLKGKVFKSDCTTSLKDALVEIWHCNTEGEYDNETDEYRLRASLNTNEKGEYSFTTILPGKYLNGKLYRPAHIHYRVTEMNSKELISQIYFKGDPHITKDPWASQNRAKHRILQMTPEDINGNLTINFDIYLVEK
jgi:protocatechuate 3,4-dioxygenase beta subunit